MTDDEKFDLFCQLAETFQENIFSGVTGQVKAAMKVAGEDPENEVLVKTRVQQVLYSLFSRADREVSAVLYSTDPRII